MRIVPGELGRFTTSLVSWVEKPLCPGNLYSRLVESPPPVSWNLWSLSHSRSRVCFFPLVLVKTSVTQATFPSVSCVIVRTSVTPVLTNDGQVAAVGGYVALGHFTIGSLSWMTPFPVVLLTL